MVGFFDLKLETSDAVSKMEHVSDTSPFSIHNCTRNTFYSNCFIIGAESVHYINMQRFNLFAYFQTSIYPMSDFIVITVCFLED